MDLRILRILGLIEKSKAFCEAKELKYAAGMAECDNHDSSFATGTGIHDRLQMKRKELRSQLVGLNKTFGEKKAKLEKDKHKLAMMKRVNEDKIAKVMELNEAEVGLKRKVERAQKVNMLKREDIEPVANAIQRKRSTIDSVMKDPIFAVIFITMLLFLSTTFRKSRI